MTNRLADERSLYLRQHADNPVDWYPWGEEAFALARERDVPLFVSIGYSSCHWCHVMAHESFEDEEVAALLNEHFVSVKIDREEHPEVDSQYMLALMLIAGHGGWPMSVFALPDGRPFFAGTYFPKWSRYGQPGFMDLLQRIAGLWTTERDKLAEDAGRLSRGVAAHSVAAEPAELDPAGLHTVLARSVTGLDATHGGRSGAPKFPPHTDLALWHYALAEGLAGPEVETALRTTLDGMAWSGLRDIVGGGFHRYCVDAAWRVPHFEQMLYDNAQLLETYSAAVAAGEDPADRAVLRGMLDDLSRRWVTDGGWFAVAWDADDPGGEGGFYTWTPDELDAALGAEDGAWAARYFRVEPEGPVEGRSTLWPMAPPERPGAAADQVGEPAAIWQRLDRILPTLAEARAGRPRPDRDDKGVVGLNGLMLRGLAAARRAVGEAFPKALLPPAAELVRWAEMDPLPRAVYGDAARGEGQLEDYAGLAHGLWRWGLAADEPAAVAAATSLADRMVARFADEGQWQSARTEAPLGAPAGWFDGQQPSAYALALDLVAELGVLHGGERWQEAAHSLVHTVSGAMARNPDQSKALWTAYHRLAGGIATVILWGRAADPWYAALSPRTPAHLVWVRPAVSAWMADREWGALAGRTDREPAAYLCRGGVCQLPASDPSALADQLGGG